MESLAGSWLVDEAWQKVFKHTLDVVQSYVINVLVAIDALTFTVTLTEKPIACMMLGVEPEGQKV